jgi:hypothetical protein
MKKVLFGVVVGVACLLGLGAANEARADVVIRAAVRPYHLTYGVRFGGGYYFAGRNHSHWGHRAWDARYHRYVYWEPSLRIYYYYDAGRGGYYPCP